MASNNNDLYDHAAANDSEAVRQFLGQSLPHISDQTMRAQMLHAAMLVSAQRGYDGILAALLPPFLDDTSDPQQSEWLYDALSHSARNGHKRVASRLKSTFLNMENLDSFNRLGGTWGILNIAAGQGHTEILNLFRELTLISPTSYDEFHNNIKTAALVSATRGHCDACQYLIDWRGHGVGARDAQFRAMLREILNAAAAADQLEIVKLILEDDPPWGPEVLIEAINSSDEAGHSNVVVALQAEFLYKYPWLVAQLESTSRAHTVIKLYERSEARRKGMGICTICQARVALRKRKIVGLPCMHFFHLKCIRPWLFESDTCPLCRAKIE